MKKLLVTLGAVLLAVSTHAQGTVQLITRGLTDAAGNSYDAAFANNAPGGYTGATVQCSS